MFNSVNVVFHQVQEYMTFSKTQKIIKTHEFKNLYIVFNEINALLLESFLNVIYFFKNVYNVVVLSEKRYIKTIQNMCLFYAYI